MGVDLKHYSREENQLKKSLSSLMRYFLQSLLVLSLSAPLIILLTALQTAPTILENEPITMREVSTVESLILNMAPEALGESSVMGLSLDISEINLLIRYSLRLTGLSEKWNARLAVKENSVISTINWNLLSEWLPVYMNLNGTFLNEDGQLHLSQLTIGKIKVPENWIAWFEEVVRTNLLTSSSAYQMFGQIREKVSVKSITDSKVQIEMQWEPELVLQISDQVQRLLISSEDQERIIKQYLLINDIVTTLPSDTRAISLTALLAPMFDAAYKNSIVNDDPIGENRALFQTLAIYVNNDEISKLIEESDVRNIPKAKFIEVRLLRRQDLAQHVASIAAISVSLGPELAELVSTTKETYDARYRSGFSFSDLTANKVGLALAGLAIKNRGSAFELQRRLTNIETETDLIPEVGSNRDGISESDFNAIYADRSSAEYLERINEIKIAIESKPIFQGL